MIKIDDIKSNKEIGLLIQISCVSLDAMGYTEHGLRHANIVSNLAGRILSELGYDRRQVELAKIAGYVHDVGNSINRHNHGISSALLMYPILKEMGMPIEDVVLIISAIGNHEEEIGTSVNDVSAALVIADKSDAHRTRVRSVNYDPDDIHDRVNYSIKKNFLDIDAANKTISNKFYMTENSSVMEFLKIYLSRIDMSEKAARVLGCTYKLYINDVKINAPKKLSEKVKDKFNIE